MITLDRTCPGAGSLLCNAQAGGTCAGKFEGVSMRGYAHVQISGQAAGNRKKSGRGLASSTCAPATHIIVAGQSDLECNYTYVYAHQTRMRAS